MARSFRLMLARWQERGPSRGARRAWAFFASFLLAACGSRLPAPPTGPHPAGSTVYIDVPYPPPAARVEVVPAPPRDPGAVWVDGEWAWQGKRWAWLAGGWVVPPRGAYFAPWLVYRLDNGRLLFASGSWHATGGDRIPNPVVLDAARNGLDDEGSPQMGAPSASGTPP
ncbi:MAG TPA: hypothetical protein VK550_05685 [Polyangiaceae bacterium]|nr:hypothetical protein [Polyangiaceae bacterium]